MKYRMKKYMTFEEYLSDYEAFSKTIQVSPGLSKNALRSNYNINRRRFYLEQSVWHTLYHHTIQLSFRLEDLASKFLRRARCKTENL